MELTQVALEIQCILEYRNGQVTGPILYRFGYSRLHLLEETTQEETTQEEGARAEELAEIRMMPILVETPPIHNPIPLL